MDPIENNTMPPDAEVAAGFDSLRARAEPPAPKFTIVGEGPTLTPVPEYKKGDAWLDATQWVTDLVVEVCDGWKFNPASRKLLTRGLAEMLDGWFPGGIENMDQWGTWAKLIAAGTVIGVTNFDWKHWRRPAFKPMQKAEDNETKTETGTADSSSGPHAVG